MSLRERLTGISDEMGMLASDLRGLQEVIEQYCDSHPDMHQFATINLMGRMAAHISEDVVALGNGIHQLGIEQEQAARQA